MKNGVQVEKMRESETRTTSAVIYSRVSTDEQSHGYSILTQIEACKKFAAEHGYCVLNEFSDDYTGDSLDRPGLNKLNEFIASHSIDIVIVYCVDRLARKLVYQLLIDEEFERSGIRVEYVREQYPDTEEGRLQKQFSASVAEYEKAKIIERSKRGLRGKALSGHVICGSRPPYGYIVKSEPHKSWLEIDEKEAKIVRLVFQWYVNGEGSTSPFSFQKIALKLTRMHIPTRGDKVKHVAKKRGFGVWSTAMVKHILSSETYTGIWHYGKTIMVADGKKKKSGARRGCGKQVPRPRAEWIPVKVPAIIGKDLFQRAEERRLLNYEQNRKNTKYEYLLRRRLRCAKCGYIYQGRTRKNKNQYYFCRGRSERPVSLCDMPIFQAKRLETAVWEWVKSLLLHPDRLVQGLRGMQAEKEAANNVIRERKTLLDNSLLQNKQKREKLLNLYLEDKFPKEVLLDRITKLENDLSEMIREREEISSYLIPIDLPNEDIKMIESFCSEVRNGLDNATFEDKRRYMDLLDLRCALALENHEKVAYLRCKIGAQRRSLMLTSPSSNIGAIGTTGCACPPTTRFR